MRKGIFLIITLTFFLAFASSVEARSGCCSHHGGVCGCGCCDGTSLSAKCAPYYPECSGSESVQGVQEQPVYTPSTNTPKPLPTWTAIPTRIPKPTKTPTITPTPTKEATISATIIPKKTIKKAKKVKKTVKKTTKNKTFWQWLFGK